MVIWSLYTTCYKHNVKCLVLNVYIVQCYDSRNLPEVSLEDFKKIDLKNYKWIHFEVK